MSKFFTGNDLISQNKAGFKSGGSRTYQLVSITHQIYKSFDGGHKVQSVLLDMSKAFNKVWLKGLIFKIKQTGISGNLLNTLKLWFLKIQKTKGGVEWWNVFMFRQDFHSLREVEEFREIHGIC